MILTFNLSQIVSKLEMHGNVQYTRPFLSCWWHLANMMEWSDNLCSSSDHLHTELVQTKFTVEWHPSPW